MLFRPNPSSSVPVYVQLVEQLKHAIETGALRAGEQLPSIRKVAEELVINANTVVKAYRELEREGVIETRQGSGAFVVDRPRARARIGRWREARPVVSGAVAKLRALGFDESEMRRAFEAEVRRLREQEEPRTGPKRRE